MKVYLDLFFIVNFFMNLLIFAVMNLLGKKRAVTLRSAASSGTGAASAVLLLVAGGKDKLLVFALMYVLVSGLMIRIAYGKTTFAGMLRWMGLFYLTAVVLAGVIVFLREFTAVRRVSLSLLLISAVLILFAAQKIRFGSGTWQMTQQLFPVRIKYHGKSVEATGLLDTGNTLVEPVSRKSVSVVEYRLFRKVLSEEEKGLFDRAVREREMKSSASLLLRYIPFHSIGKERDYLPGVMVDNLEIYIDGRTTVCTGKTWLGLYDRFLSADGRYDLLLNSRLCGKQ